MLLNIKLEFVYLYNKCIHLLFLSRYERFLEVVNDKNTPLDEI